MRAANLYGMLASLSAWRAEWHANLGRRQQANALLAESRRNGEKSLALLAPESFQRKFLPENAQRWEFAVAEAEGDYVRLRDATAGSIARLAELKTVSEGQARARDETLARAYFYLAQPTKGFAIMRRRKRRAANRCVTMLCCRGCAGTTPSKGPPPRRCWRWRSRGRDS
jgi:hypothetical protein